MQVVIGTHNRGKYAELEQALMVQGVNVVRDIALESISEPEEHGESFIENALIKACAYSARISRPVISDDSGLVISALGGAPGIFSKRYTGSGDFKSGRQKILDELEKKTSADRKAFLVCALCIAFPSGQTLVTEFRRAGRIVSSVDSSAPGIGYEPIFVPADCERTLSELSDVERLRAHPRTGALSQLFSAWKAL